MRKALLGTVLREEINRSFARGVDAQADPLSHLGPTSGSATSSSGRSSSRSSLDPLPRWENRPSRRPPPISASQGDSRATSCAKG
jgi:hypothetical protein